MSIKNNSDLYLHVGLHKTGTSSLQKFLCENSSLLKSHNFFYPTFYKINLNLLDFSVNDIINKPRNNFIRAHHRLFRALKEKDKFLKKKQAIQSIYEYKKICINENLKLILSAENISGFLKQDYFLKKNNKEDFLSTMRLYFNQFNIIPIISFRNHYSYFLSFYSEKTKNNWGKSSMSKTFAQYLKEQTLRLPYFYSNIYQLLELLSTEGKIITLTFEESIKFNLISYFLKKIKCNYKKQINNIFIREGFSMIALELKRYISNRIKTKKQNQAVSKFLISEKYKELEKTFLSKYLHYNFNSNIDFILFLQNDTFIESEINKAFNSDLKKLKIKVDINLPEYSYQYKKYFKNKNFNNSINSFFEDIYENYLRNL